MAKAGMNPKALQYIMGHSDISITLNTYTHFSFKNATEDMCKITEGIEATKKTREKRAS